MRMTMGRLRRMLVEALLSEEGANHSYPGQPQARNVLSPDVNNREQLGAISAKGLDTVDDPDQMPDHLTQPTVDPEDCYGPVPPDAEPPYVGQDPFVRDSAPQPFSGGGSIRRG